MAKNAAQEGGVPFLWSRDIFIGRRLKMNIQVKGLVEAMRFMDDVQKKQLPFAVAVALTRTAQDVQKEIIEVLPSRFTLRTSWYKSGPYAFKVQRAEKSNLQSRIYTSAPFMSLQETGGIKIAHKGKKMLAIPTKNVRPNISSRIPNTLRPAFLLHGQSSGIGQKRRRIKWRQMGNASSAFIGTLRDTRLGLWQRTAAGKLRLMYQLQPEAEIHPRLFFEQTGRKIVDDKWSSNFGRAFNEAIRTAK